MHLTLVGHKLCSCQSQPRRDNPFNGGIVGKIQEEANVLHTSILLKVLLEEPRSLHVYSHGGEHDGEVVLGAGVNTYKIKKRKENFRRNSQGKVVFDQIIF